MSEGSGASEVSGVSDASRGLPKVAVSAVSLWTRGYATPEAWLAGEPDEEAHKPEIDLLPRRKRRRATFKTRMAAHVIGRLADEAGFDPADVSTVFASVLGEVEAAVTLIEMLHEDAFLSPTRFQNSVHNTAAGLISIATENRRFSSSLAATWDVAAMGLLEATTRVLVEDEPTVLVLLEEPWPVTLRLPPIEPLAIGLYLLPVEAGPAGKAPGLTTISNLRRTVDAPVPDVIVPDGLEHNPVAGALGLVQAIVEGRAGTVRLDLGEAESNERWVIDVNQSGDGEP